MTDYSIDPANPLADAPAARAALHEALALLDWRCLVAVGEPGAYYCGAPAVHEIVAADADGNPVSFNATPMCPDHARRAIESGQGAEI